MAQTIKLKRSATAGAAPTTSQLELGEVAINTYDGKMYIKKSVGGTESIVEISGGGGTTAADAIFEEYLYTATNNQTAFSGNDDNSSFLSYVSGAIQVFLNGVLLDPETDYTATNGATVTLTSAAATNDYLQIIAFKKKISDGSVTVDTFSGNNSTTAFTLSLDPGDENNTRVFIDGVYQSKSNYAVSGTTLTFSSAPPSGTSIEVEIGNRVVSLDTTSSLDLPDNVQLRLGTGQDMKVYHTGSHGILTSSTGDIRYQSNTRHVFSDVGFNETHAIFNDNGAVNLWYDGSKKFETTSAGIEVTGSVTSDSLVISGTNANLTFGTSGNNITFGRNGDNYIDAQTGTSSNIVINPQNRFVVNTSDLERIRIDSSGNLLVAKTNTTFSTTGIELRAGNGGSRFIRSNAEPILMNRTGSDGKVLGVYKDGSEVGSIGADGGDMYLHNGITGIIFNDANNAILPYRTNTEDDANIDIGHSSYRFQDLFLSGQVSTGTISSGTITTTGELRGPATFVIDPAAVGDNTGTVQIKGNLQVDGSTTTINSTTLTVDDLNITLASGAANASAANGAGITVDGASATLTYVSSTDTWDFNKNVKFNTVQAHGSNNFTVDSPAEIHLDSHSGFTRLRSQGGDIALLQLSNNDLTIRSMVSDRDIIFQGYDGSTNTTALTLDMSDAGSATFNNRVGIGGVTPQTKLHLKDTSNALEISLEAQAQANYPKLVGASASGTNDTYFAVDFVTRGERLRVDGETGYVGIGTTSPTTRLSVTNSGFSNTSTSGIPAIRAEGNYGGAIGLLDTKEAGWYAQNNGDTLYQYVGRASGTAPNASIVMTYKSSGNIGIGTNSPAAKLHISGNSDISDEDCMLIIDDVDGSAGSRIPAIMFRSNTGGTVTNQGRIRGTDTHGIVMSGSSALGEDLAVQAGGVGIGTTSTSGKLHVKSAGTGNVFYVESSDGHHLGGFYQESDTRAAFNVRNASGSATINLDSAGDSWFNGGDLGIGTTSPSAPLDIQTSHSSTDVTAANSNSTLRIGNSAAGNGVYNAIKFAANQQDMYIMSFNNNQQADRRLGFFLGSVAGDATTDERLSILGNGNVGIGTTSPAATLEVENSSGAMMMVDDTNGRFIKIRSANSGSQNANISSYSGLYLGGADNANHMLITNAGKVGIGTTSPGSFVESSRFVVGSGTSGTNEMMFLYSGTDAFGAIGFADGTSGSAAYRGIIGYHHEDDELFFSTNGGGEADRDVTITSAGNVGIGKETPAAKLDVAGGHIRLDSGMSLQWGDTHERIEQSDSRLEFFTNNTEKMTLKGGYLGVGTTEPRYNLTVQGNSTTAVGIGVDNQSGSSTLDIAALGSGYNSHQAGAGEVWFYSPDHINIGGATGNSNHIKFIGNNAVRMKIDGGNGSVLVAATSTDTSSSMGGQTPKLYVNGYTSLGGLRINGSDSGNTIYRNGGDISIVSANNNVKLEAGGGGTIIANTRFQPNEHIIFGSNTGYLQFPGSSSRAWAMASSGGTAAPGTQSATFGFHHWSGSAWSNPVNISASGKLGVGTSNPVARGLDVLTNSSNTFTSSNDSWHSLVVRNDAAAANNCVGLAFNVSGGYHQNAGTGIAAVKNGTNSDHGAHLVFVTRPQSAVAEERMRITDAGRVFIGTTTASNAQFRVAQTTSGEWAANIIHNSGTAYGLSVDTSSSTATSTFNFAAYTPAGTGFFVKNHGGVGIGDTNPPSSVKLAIQHDGLGIRLDGTSNTERGIMLRNVGGNAHGYFKTDGHMRLIQEDAGKEMAFYVGNTERLRINSSGNTEAVNGHAINFYRSGNSAYGSLFMDTGENLYIRNSWGVKDIKFARDGIVTMPGDIIPATADSFDLGSSSARWDNVYTNDLHLSNEGSGGNDVDGTTGNWTVQEGAENLYLINNKTGKKYKFALEEIE